MRGVWESLSQNADGVPGCLTDLRDGVHRGLFRNLRQEGVAEPFDAAAVDDSEADIGSVKDLLDLPDLKKLQTRRKVLFQCGIAAGRLAGLDVYLPDGAFVRSPGPEMCAEAHYPRAMIVATFVSMTLPPAVCIWEG